MCCIPSQIFWAKFQILANYGLGKFGRNLDKFGRNLDKSA